MFGDRLFAGLINCCIALHGREQSWQTVDFYQEKMCEQLHLRDEPYAKQVSSSETALCKGKILWILSVEPDSLGPRAGKGGKGNESQCFPVTEKRAQGSESKITERDSAKPGKHPSFLTQSLSH